MHFSNGVNRCFWSKKKPKQNNKTTLDIMFDDVLNRKEGFCILENVILTVLKTCILPMELTMILLKIMKFLFSLVIY